MTVGYTIHTKSNGNLDADATTTGPSEANRQTRGETATYTFLISGADFDTLRQFGDHAGSFTVLGTLNNVQKFRERLPAGASVDSLLLGIEPDTELINSNIDGVWGLVANATDNRTTALTNDSITLEIRILAEYSDYADHTAVENALEV